MSEAQNGGNVMERLTQRLRTGEVLMASEYEEKYTEQEWISVLQDRLAAYEETGLTPGEVKSMQEEHFSGLEMAKLHSALMELKKYQEADKDGRLVVPPCKAGDTVYEVTSRKTISEYRVKAIRVELFCTFIEWDIVVGFVDKSIFGVPVDEIGKTVFLTHEEAKKTLEAMKDGNG